jgi:hypothetical protein
MTLTKKEDTGGRGRKYYIALFGELTLEDVMNLS